jgi:hypothetical protein
MTRIPRSSASCIIVAKSPRRALADKDQGYAQRIGTQWPRTRRMLQRIAQNWDRRARQEDQLAAAREDFCRNPPGQPALTRKPRTHRR